MHTIYYGEIPVHDSALGIFALEASIEFSTQSSPTMHLRLASTHDAIQHLAEFDTENEMIVSDDERVIFVGRICSMSQDISGNVSVECEDSLAYLNDTVVRPYANYDTEDAARIYANTAGELFEWYLQQHNRYITDESRRIYAGECFCANLPIQAASTERPSTKAEIVQQLCDRIGGYVVMRYENGQKLLDYVADTGECSQAVQYGVNMLSYDNQLDATEVFTAIVPTNAEIALSDSDASLVRSLTGYTYDGGAIVDDAAQSVYGRIERTKDYEAETKVELIYQAARDLQAAAESQTITVSALDLSMLEDAEPIQFLQLVTVNNTLTGSQNTMLCTRMHLDILAPYNNTYELGSVYDTMTGITANAGTGGGNSDAAAISAAVNGAIQAHNASSTAHNLAAWVREPDKPTYTAQEITGLATVATTGSYNDLTDKPPAPTYKPPFFEGDYNGWHYRRSDDWMELWQSKTVAFKAGNNWSDTAMPTALPFADKHFAVLAHAEDWRVQNLYIGSANDSDRPGRNSFKIGATNSASSVVNALTFVNCFGKPAPSWALFPARTRSSGWYSSVLDELGNVTITGHATTTKVGTVIPLSAITGVELPAGTYRLKLVGDDTIKSVVSRNNPNTADCYHLSMYVAPDSSHTDPTQAVAFTIVDGATPTQAELDVMAGRDDTFTLAQDGTALIISMYPPTTYEWTGSAQYLIERVE